MTIDIDDNVVRVCMCHVSIDDKAVRVFMRSSTLMGSLVHSVRLLSQKFVDYGELYQRSFINL